jgi:hypothetical protein
MTRKVVRKIGQRTSRRSSVSNNTKTTTVSGRVAPGKGKFGRNKPLPDLVTTTSTSGNRASEQTSPVTTVTNANYSGLILTLLTTLLIVAFWNEYFLVLWDALYNGKKPSFKNGIGPMVGGIVFVLIISMLGAVPALSGVILLFTVGLWIVYLVMGGNISVVSSIMNFFSGGKTTPPSTAAPAPPIGLGNSKGP